ncbi:exported protein of unknown function [Ralstonia solanacearum PSI07]|nr:exported protein of unknown function [Ralstonia solanacearum PSI07]
MAIALMALSSAAHAWEPSLLVYGASDHIGHYTNMRKQQINPGVGLEAATSGWLLGAGVYRDSYTRTAYMAYGGYRWTLPIGDDWRVALSARGGYLNGSGYHGLVAAPTVGIGYKRGFVEASVFPSHHGRGLIIGLWFRYQFDDVSSTASK